MSLLESILVWKRGMFWGLNKLVWDSTSSGMGGFHMSESWPWPEQALLPYIWAIAKAQLLKEDQSSDYSFTILSWPPWSSANSFTASLLSYRFRWVIWRPDFRVSGTRNHRRTDRFTTSILLDERLSTMLVSRWYQAGITSVSPEYQSKSACTGLLMASPARFLPNPNVILQCPSTASRRWSMHGRECQFRSTTRYVTPGAACYFISL